MVPADSPNTFTFSVGKKGNSSESINPESVIILSESTGGLISNVSYSSTDATMTVEYIGEKGNALVAAITGDATTQ